jgi:hypothetical protein
VTTRTAAAATLTLAALALAVPAGAAGAEPAAGTDCQEQQSFVDGDPAFVAARLPEGYTAMHNPASGRPLVFARGLRCRELTLGGHTGPIIMASYGVLIDSPDGRGCGSAAPSGSVKGDAPPVCNWYVLRWLASDRRVVDWLRHGTPGFPAVHAPGLVFDLGTFDPARAGTPLNIRADGPSPFAIDAIMHDSPRELAVRGGYWVDTPQGRVKVALSSDDLLAADGDGVVRAGAGSEVAQLMGAEERSYAPVYDGFASVRAGHGVYRKQVLPRPGSTDGFAGSCALEGTVTFKPPATNDSQPLSSDFTGSGKCTGTLDGRDLKDAPVSVYQAGRAEGGCRSAKTVAPWIGTLRFESGEALRYTLDFTTQSTEVSGTIYGERSGAAPGRGSFLTDRTGPDILERCAGEGVTTVPLDFSFATHTALVNEPVSTPPVERGKLRLAVTPRSVRSARRTTFAFRVTGAGARPVAGAFVRFFGRRVQTDRAGMARIAATLRGRGAHEASAKLAGFRGARVAISVRR